jgi:hypothetical protein
MNKKLIPLLISGLLFSSSVFSQSLNEEFMGEVNVRGRRTNEILPEFPSTTSAINAKEIEDTVNAIDAPDVLKYYPILWFGSVIVLTLMARQLVVEFGVSLIAPRLLSTLMVCQSAINYLMTTHMALLAGG